jgi:Thioesterase superfamily
VDDEAVTDLGEDDAPLLSNIQFDDLVVGRRFGPYDEWVSAAMADRLRSEVGVVHAGRLAGPGVFPVLFLKVLRRAMGGIPSETVLAKQEFEFHAPVPVDTEVRCATWVGEKYVRRNRSYVVIEFEIHNADGELALTGRKVIMWPEPREGT